jgi:hypothetical protein
VSGLGQQRERGRAQRGAHVVKDHRRAAGAERVARAVYPFGVLRVDYGIRTERRDPLALGRVARDGDDAPRSGAGELDQRQSEPAAGAEHQYGVVA